jgi:hypothetical protein
MKPQLTPSLLLSSAQDPAHRPATSSVLLQRQTQKTHYQEPYELARQRDAFILQLVKLSDLPNPHLGITEDIKPHVACVKRDILEVMNDRVAIDFLFPVPIRR